MGFTKVKEIFRNIGRTKSNFISIILFVTFGIALFQGLDYTSNAILESMNNAFDNQVSYDIQIPYALGCSKEEINKFKENEHISRAEGYHSCYEYTEIDNEVHACMIHSLTKEINKPTVVEGKLPENDNEIVLIQSSAEALDLHINDNIIFKDGDGYSNYLISQLRDITTRTDILDIANDATDNFLNNEFKIVGFVSHPNYYNHGIASYGTYPNTAVQVELIGFVNYSAFNPRITNGYYTNVLLQSDELSKYARQSDKYKKSLDELTKEINVIAQNIERPRYELCRNNIETVLDIESIVTKIATILKGLGYISEETYSNYSEIRSEIEKYSQKLSKVETVNLIPIYNNPVFSFGTMPSDAVKNCKYSLGGVFLLIATLICFSSLNRLVADDIKLIGTKKALGFKKKEFYFSYLGYTLLAAITGIILGNIFSVVFEYFLVPVTTSALDFPVIRTYINPIMILVISLIIVAALELITIFACESSVRKNIIDLLQGKNEKEHAKTRFYEKTKIWKRMPLLNRAIIDNAVNDKKRCISTIIGVAASACLIIGSITMNKNVVNSIEVENKEHFKFDSFVYFDSENEDSLNNILSYFEENEIKATPLRRELVYMDVGNDEKAAVYLMVYQKSPSFDDVFGIEPAGKQKFNYSGMWINESVKEGFGVKQNATTTITTLNGEEISMKVDGFYKTYTYFISAFIDESSYEEAFECETTFNTFAVNLRDSDLNKVKNDLAQIEGYKSIFDYQSYIKETLDSFTLVADVIVYIYLAVSILMGFFVILNLLIAFVTEKKRELITLMINGYSYKKACQYIYVDTIILTIIGLIIGVVLGSLFGNWVITAFETGYIHMARSINLFAILIGCSITILITILMSIIAARKIKKYKLTDINSSTI